MRKLRSIIILVVVLGLLVGAYVYIINRPEDETLDSGDEKVEISKAKKDDIVKMVLESEDGTLTFEKKDEEWIVDYPHPVVLKQMSVDDIAYSFASLYAEKIVEEAPEDLSIYGLDKPKVTAKAFFKDGTEKVLFLGNKTPAGNTYYLMAEGDPKVYAVWMNHGEHFSYKLSDVRDKSLGEIKIEELTYLKIAHKDKPAIEVKINDKQSEDEAQFGLGLWQMTQPYNEPMGIASDNFQKLLEAIPSLAISGFVEDDPQDLAKYGLDEPLVELVVKDKENTLHLYFGTDSDEKNVYFKTADLKAVYTMEKEKIEFLNTKPFEIVEKFAYIVNIDNVDKIIVEGQGKSHTLTLTRETKKAEKEDEEDEVITTYKVDGNEVEEKPFKKYYQSLIGLLVDAENKKELEENPEVKTTFFLNKGSRREVHINYVNYDNDFYAVFRSGKAEFLISREQVKKMLSDLEALIRGDLIKDE